MDRLWPVPMMVGVVVANVPALREQWRTDRAGLIKTIELFGVYLVYCLLGAGLIIWLAARAHESDAGSWTVVAPDCRNRGLDFLWSSYADSRCAAL